jgi:hypothetical protein
MSEGRPAQIDDRSAIGNTLCRHRMAALPIIDISIWQRCQLDHCAIFDVCHSDQRRRDRGTPRSGGILVNSCPETGR